MGFKIGPQNLKVGRQNDCQPKSKIYLLFEMVGGLLEQSVSLHQK